MQTNKGRVMKWRFTTIPLVEQTNGSESRDHRNEGDALGHTSLVATAGTARWAW